MTGCRQDQSESWSALFPRAALIGGRFYDNRRIAKSPAPPSTVVLVGIELPRGETEASLFAADEDAPSPRWQLHQYSVLAGKEFNRAMVGRKGAGVGYGVDSPDSAGGHEAVCGCGGCLGLAHWL